MEFRVHRSKASAILMGIAAIVLGFFAFMNPLGAVFFLTLVTGWTLVFTGIVLLVSAFRHIDILLSQSDFYWGLLSVLMGVLIVIWPQFFVDWIFVLLGLFIMMMGFNSTFAANYLRRLGLKGAGWGMVSSFLVALFGFLVILTPFLMADVSMMVAGIALVYAGIVSIGDGIRMKSGEDLV